MDQEPDRLLVLTYEVLATEHFLFVGECHIFSLKNMEIVKWPNYQLTQPARTV